MEIVQILKYLLMIVIIAMLGLNIFAYLAKGTDIASNILSKLIELTEQLTGRIFKTSLTGTKTGIKIAEKTASGVVGELERVIDGGLLTSTHKVEQSNNQIRGKRGYCFIGEDNGIRSCVRVGLNDTCMSGNIFPSMDICINPNLRNN